MNSSFASPAFVKHSRWWAILINQTKPKRLRIFFVACLLLHLLFHQQRRKHDANDFDELVYHRCRDYTRDISVVQEDGGGTLRQVAEMLSLVDHTFVLSTEGCKTSLPVELHKKSTCILGKRLDECAPSVLLAGAYQHAMKVTFAHAFILQMAVRANYRHIVVIEDDLVFVERNFSSTVRKDFSILIQSKSWSFIRFGYRPYFLQHSANIPCPSQCRCSTSHEFGEHFCRLRAKGCDLRSSDLYVLRAPYFHLLREKLLNTKVSSSKRIVDTHPFKQFADQWLFVPQVSFQRTLDIPMDYQLGLGALYNHKCVGPRPLQPILRQQIAAAAAPN